MRFTIYSLIGDEDYMAFDRDVPEAITNSSWDDWSPVGIFESDFGDLEPCLEAQAHGIRSHYLHCGGERFTAQQVTCGDAGEWVWEEDKKDAEALAAANDAGRRAEIARMLAAEIAGYENNVTLPPAARKKAIADAKARAKVADEALEPLAAAAAQGGEDGHSRSGGDSVGRDQN